MCKDGHTYLVSYKDIKIPITLKLYNKGAYGSPTFKMYIANRYLGAHHWCLCSHRSWIKYCEECIGYESNKITRAVNIMQEGASKLRGKALRDIFEKHFNVDWKNLNKYLVADAI